MSRLRIYTFPDDVLKKRAAEVESVDEDLRRLADDMIETMYDAPGIGLAANQVGILKRIVIVDTDYSFSDEEEGSHEFIEGADLPEGSIMNKDPKIIINPEILMREGETQFCEGCLSVPEFTADVFRAEKIKLRYMDIDGKTKELSSEGLQAVCIQHEIDHLDGRLFIDRLSPAKRELVKRKLLKERQKREGRR